MILGTFYEAVMQRILSEIPAIKHIDYYFNQIENEEEELPFNTPAVFFEYSIIPMKAVGNKIQKANVAFNIYLACEVIQEMSSSETLALRTKALEHLNLLNEITIALIGHNGTGFASISPGDNILPFAGERKELIVHVLPFTVLLTNDDVKTIRTRPNPLPTLNATGDML